MKTLVINNEGPPIKTQHLGYVARPEVSPKSGKPEIVISSVDDQLYPDKEGNLHWVTEVRVVAMRREGDLGYPAAYLLLMAGENWGWSPEAP